MKHTNTIKAALYIMLIATLGSCVKGDTGATGANGTNGANGLNGSANITWSDGTTNSSSWGWNTSSNENYATFSWSGITQGIVDSGTVFVYLSNGNGGWEALPFTDYGSSVSLSYYYVYNVNTLGIWVTNSNRANVASSLNANAETFKVLTITPALRKAHPNTNWNDYNEVMAVLHETN